jgi:hypothetical protein
VEISGTESHLFPYQQLVTASLVRQDAIDLLRLTFPSHDVEITGRNLRELLVGVQEFEVKWLRAIPERYQPAGSESAAILTIRISGAT